MPSLEQTVRELASDRCEYCQVPQIASRFGFVLDHIIARQHGGATEVANPALCCGRCNQYKGPNISSIDPVLKHMVRLFHPRQDNWSEHFRYEGPVLVGS